MSAARKVSLAASLALLAACGGGGGDPPPPPPVGFTVSGTIRPAAAQAIDTDTNDPSWNTPNDTPATAQPLPRFVTVGGWAAQGDDDVDAFRVTLLAGQVITLTVAEDPAADLDLYLYDETVTEVASSVLGSAVESLVVPSDGTFYVTVEVAQPPPVSAASNRSNYVLNLGAVGAAGARRASFSQEFVPGEVLIRFSGASASAVSAAAARARVEALGLEYLDGAPGPEVLVGLGPAAGRSRTLSALGADAPGLRAFGMDRDLVAIEKRETLALVKALRARGDVVAAPNYVHHATRVPRDEFYPLQWHYPLINLPAAWDITTGAPGAGAQDVVVAVIDTGIVAEHPDFQGQLVGGYDFILSPTRARDGNARDANPNDEGDAATPGASSWHGSHVAGTIAARSDEVNRTAAGVAWGAKVMPLRALGVGGGTSADIVAAVRYAAGLDNASGQLPARPAAILNLSLGCLGCDSPIDQQAYADARQAGLLIVAAAGNENTTQPSYPASYPGVVSVSAVDSLLARAPYSNRGLDVDVAAPGGNAAVDRDGNGFPDGVLSAVADDSSTPRGLRWAFLQGTSMAAPHVAGVAALMKATCPGLAPANFDELLAAGSLTNDRGTAGKDDVYGWGVLDALKSVEAARDFCGAPVPARLVPSPSRIDFGPTDGPLTLTVTRTGEGALAVASVADDAAWLSVTSAGVDASGLGSYTVTPTRTGLADGAYSATITFTLQGGGTVAVPVALRQGVPAAGEVGIVYVLLVDSAFDSVAQRAGRVTAAGLPYSFTGVRAGDYYVIAGTDSDWDDVVCDPGEACGAWPTLGIPTPLSVNANAAGIDFLAGFQAGLAAGANVTGAPEGFRRLPDEKRIGGAR